MGGSKADTNSSRSTLTEALVHCDRVSREGKFGEPCLEAEPRRSQDVGHMVRRARATATGAVHRDPRADLPIDGNGDGADRMLAVAIKGANAPESILPKRIDPELAGRLDDFPGSPAPAHPSTPDMGDGLSAGWTEHRN